MTEYWIWLSLAMHGASIKTDELINKFSNPKNVFENRESIFKGKYPVLESDHKRMMNKELDSAYYIMENAKEQNVKILTPDSPDFPECFREIYGVPLALFVKGDIELLSDPLKATVVGSRRPTEYSVAATYRLTYDLAKAGVTIVSGCAMGIDYVAHRAALNAGGKTIAFLASGIDVDYPTNHNPLKEEILEKGTIVTEYPFGMEADPSHFAPRNRLIAASSLGTIVTQAGERSGALLTANHASEQGKDVYAIPDSIFNSKAIGSLKLVKDGAYLMTSSSDFLMNYIHLFPERMQLDKIPEHTDFLQIKDDLFEKAIKHRYTSTPVSKPLEKEEGTFVPLVENASETAKKIYDFLLNGPADLDSISAELGVDTTIVYSEVTLLELEECIAQKNDMFYIPKM